MSSPESQNSTEALRQSSKDAAYALLEGTEYYPVFDPRHGEPLWKKGLDRVINGRQLFRQNSFQVEHGFYYVSVTEGIRRLSGKDEPVSLIIRGLWENPTVGGLTISWALDLLEQEQDVNTIQLVHALLSDDEPSGKKFTELIHRIPYTKE